jgi:hypothetical protein
MLKRRAYKQWNRVVALLALVAVAMVARPANSAADSQSTPWSAPSAIASGLTHAALPSLVYTPDGTVHAIWESNGGLFYSHQEPGRVWSDPVQVAWGLAPSMIATPNGELHALFANQFAGNYEIYHIRRQGSTWSLPVNVSHTSGSSGRPVLVRTEDGVLNAVWMDNTPGYWTIYHGVWSGVFWSSAPVPNSRGQVPSLAASPAGTIFLAWQDRVPSASNVVGQYDVFESELEAGDWSLPVNVSDSPDADSLGVSVAATRDGVVHATWADSSQRIQYCYGRDIYWSQTQPVWSTSSPAHGPRIIADSGGYLSIAWDQLETIWTTRALAMPAAWPKPALVANAVGALKDVTMAVLPSSRIAVGWVQADGPGDVALYTTWQASALQRRVWLPLVSR